LAICCLSRFVGGTDVDLWWTGTSWNWCSAAGVAATPRAGLPTWIGAQIGGMHLVLTAKGLQGYRQG